MARSSRRGRLGLLCGLSLLRIGYSSAHNASSTRQMVGSSFSVIAAVAAESGVIMPPGYHCPSLSG
jgi:hypothetical protein